jgi:NAD-dependent dihydropyrimidine dehydrogenase PreA subunit
MIHLRIAGFVAGLGEIGYSKMFLTPEFGPRQRLGVILTELELEPDPIYNGPQLCNRCMACVRDCPGQCIPADKTVKVTVAGHDLEWADVDMSKCDLSFRGGMETAEGETGSYFEGQTTSSPPPIRLFTRTAELYNTGQAVCGARGCTPGLHGQPESRGFL